jgi:hypothetical protein
MTPDLADTLTREEPTMAARTTIATPKAADWRAEMLDRMRSLILEVDPSITEERKWPKASNGMAGVPVWSHDGIVCTGETYRNYIKLTFAKGAALEDPTGLFNAPFTGNLRRAIDIREGDVVDARAFKRLVREAVALNTADKATPARTAKAAKAARPAKGAAVAKKR